MTGRVKIRAEYSRNLFFIRVLKAWKASLPDGDKMNYGLWRANQSIQAYSFEITGIADLKQLNGIGDSTAVRLDAAWSFHVNRLGREPTHHEVKKMGNQEFHPILEGTKSAKIREKEKRRGEKLTARPVQSTSKFDDTDDEFRELDPPLTKKANVTKKTTNDKKNKDSEIAKRSPSKAIGKSACVDLLDDEIKENNRLDEPNGTQNFYAENSQSSSQNRDDDDKYLRITPAEKGEVILICDSREVKKANKRFSGPVEHLQKSGIRVETRTLPVGDFIWVLRNLSGDELVMDWVVERKTWNDLSHSIIESRYQDQKHRLRQSPMQNRIYLIEGPGEGDIRCNQALATTLTHDHYLIQRCKTAKETANFLELITDRLVRDAKTQVITGIRYPELACFAKQSNVETVQDSWIAMIMVCPGMSASRAQILANRFPSLSSIVDFLRTDGNLVSAVPGLPRSVIQQLLLFFEPQFS